MKSLSRVRLFATPWTVAYQAPPSMGFSRQGCWSGLPFPSPGNLSDPGIEPGSPALQANALPSDSPGNIFLKLLMKTANTPSQRPRCTENLGGLGCFVLSIQCCADCYSFQSGPEQILPLYEKDPGCISNSHLKEKKFSSVAQSRPTLCDPMNHSTPGLPVHHQLPEFTQTHVH